MSRTYREDTYYDLPEEKWKRRRDKKKWFKPHKQFKNVLKSKRKARERNAFRNGKEVPRFRKEDVYDWN